MSCECGEKLNELIARVEKLESKKKRVSKEKPKGAIDLFAQNGLQDALKNVNHETQNVWLEIYEDSLWITLELKKAYSWIISNSTRAPKSDFGRFYNAWLIRGWEKKRKTAQPQSFSPVKLDTEVIDEPLD